MLHDRGDNYLDTRRYDGSGPSITGARGDWHAWIYEFEVIGEDLAASSQLSLATDNAGAWADFQETITVRARLKGPSGAALVGADVAVLPSRPDVLNLGSATAVTDAHGEATFRFISRVVGPVRFTGSSSSVSEVASLEAAFQRRKVVVLVQGMRTTLSCELDGTCQPSTEGLGAIASLISAAGFNYNLPSTAQTIDKANQILWYSYNGGTVGAAGRWIAQSYACDDTGKNLEASVLGLYGMLRTFAEAHPNTDFYLIGHSQGGLLALQALGVVLPQASSSRIAGILTFDGVLGGAPREQAYIPLLISTPQFSIPPICTWDLPAPRDLADLWSTGDRSNRQGSTAILFCSLRRLCPRLPPMTTNTNAVIDAVANRGIAVMTLANSDDGMFNPPACGIDVAAFGLNRNNSSTQFVEGALGALTATGGNAPLPATRIRDAEFFRILRGDALWDPVLAASALAAAVCLPNSHAANLANQPFTARAFVGPQLK